MRKAIKLYFKEHYNRNFWWGFLFVIGGVANAVDSLIVIGVVLMSVALAWEDIAKRIEKTLGE